MTKYIPDIAADVNPDLQADLTLAHELCDGADAITIARFRAGDLRVETKPDLTPVSEADRAVEELIRSRLAIERPDDAILGEELGVSGTGDRRWIIDPIDGTKSYVRGIPVWATLLALEVDGEPVLGVVSAPALGRRWWAARGEGAFADGEPIHASGVRAVEDSLLCLANIRHWEEVGLADAVLSLERRAWRSVGYGDFWGHVLVAEGSAEMMLEPDLAYWDVAALRPIVEEAGGRCSARTGGPPIGPGGCITTNAHLHDEVLALLAPDGANPTPSRDTP